MDLYCQECSEPWDFTEVNDAARHGEETALTPQEARDFLNGKGCPSCDFGKSAPPKSEQRSGDDKLTRGEAMSAMMELMGEDDLDGVAASLDDAEYMGYF